jgi:site-specific DNA recombinase
MRRIVVELSEEGIPTPTDYWRTQRGKPSHGKKWATSTIWNILCNPAYYGQHSAFRWEHTKRRELVPETGKMETVKALRERQFTETDDSQRTLLANAAPPIITPEVAEAVKRRLEYNQQTASRNNKHPEVALLRGGLAKCGLCSKSMILTSVGRNGQQILVYRCSGHTHASGAESPCRGTSITVDKMDTAVWVRAMQVIQNPKILREEAEKRMSESGTLSTVEGYKKTVAELEGREASVAEAISRVEQNKGYGLDTLLAQLNKIGEEKEKTLNKLKKAQKEYRSFAEVQQRLLDIEEWCAVAATIDREFTYEEKRIILFGLNTRVTVSPHGSVPRYRIRMGNEEDETLVPSLEEIEEDYMEEEAKVSHLHLHPTPTTSKANSVPMSRAIGAP